MGPSFTIVPNSQVIISRVAYQNNSSTYFINNEASNATEVTTYLRKRGIDLDNNRFLILQGEVEQISLMKPKVGEGECMYRRERRRTTRVCWSTWRTSLEQPSTFR